MHRAISEQVIEVVLRHRIVNMAGVVPGDKLGGRSFTFQGCSERRRYILRASVQEVADGDVHSDAHYSVQSDASCEYDLCVTTCHQHAEERELDPFYEALVGKPHPGCQAMGLKVIHWDDWEGVLVAESFGEVDAHFQAVELTRSYCHRNGVQVRHLDTFFRKSSLNNIWQSLFVMRCCSDRSVLAGSAFDEEPCLLVG